MEFKSYKTLDELFIEVPEVLEHLSKSKYKTNTVNNCNLFCGISVLTVALQLYLFLHPKYGKPFQKLIANKVQQIGDSSYALAINKDRSICYNYEQSSFYEDDIDRVSVAPAYINSEKEAEFLQEIHTILFISSSREKQNDLQMYDVELEIKNELVARISADNEQPSIMILDFFKPDLLVQTMQYLLDKYGENIVLRFAGLLTKRNNSICELFTPYVYTLHKVWYAATQYSVGLEIVIEDEYTEQVVAIPISTKDNRQYIIEQFKKENSIRTILELLASVLVSKGLVPAKRKENVIDYLYVFGHREYIRRCGSSKVCNDRDLSTIILRAYLLSVLHVLPKVLKLLQK